MTDNWLHVVPLDDWESFKSQVSSLLINGIDGIDYNDLIFRGQSLSSYSLSASLDRAHSYHDGAWRNKVQAECVEHFRTRNAEFSEGMSDPEILGVLQHNGCPTRLLDWTTSPYVAAFFAVSGSLGYESDEQYCVVWALNRRARPFSDPGGIVSVIDISWRKNERSRAQRGMFTVNNSPSLSVDDYLRDWDAKYPLTQPVAWKFLIPRRQTAIARRDLAAMGIDEGAIYPDLTGAAKSAYFSVLERRKG